MRTPSEFERGHIAGALNVPVDELRSRLDELPAGELVVTCQVGLRGHVGARLLIQAGLSVRNLDGGYATWSAVNGVGERGGADDGESRGTRAEAGAPDVAE